jgi:hypothetical protein
MMTPDEAISTAAMYAGRDDNDHKRIACAILQAERAATHRTLLGVATVLESLARILRSAAEQAQAGKSHGARVVSSDEWDR